MKAERTVHSSETGKWLTHIDHAISQQVANYKMAKKWYMRGSVVRVDNFQIHENKIDLKTLYNFSLSSYKCLPGYPIFRTKTKFPINYNLLFLE